jgi:hypothetical protein
MAVQAGGRQDNESHVADNPEGFTSSIPIENKKTGRWNIYIEANDKGGNTTIHGAHNIWIDPESDLPITTVINPSRFMHVQGNLNIVGSAIDDDGVAEVFFVINRGDDGRGEELYSARAEGTAFWSYLLDTTDEEKWTDGVYTVTAWAVDINGLSGVSSDFPQKAHKLHRVPFHLDRKKPVTRVTSHDIGALVTGRISMKGEVLDGNGVDSLRYSIDDGATYRNVPLKSNRQGTPTFDITFDTRGYDDGPKVIWFEARDGQGTRGAAAHLYFINNTKPALEILYPSPTEMVSGVFTIAAYASHPVGLKSVTWKLGRTTGEFPMVIGNDWWVQEFDIRGERASSFNLEIRAEDHSGNVTVAKRKLKVDRNAGILRVNLATPVANAVLSGDILNVKGSILVGPNDTAAAVMYSVNSGTPVEVPCNGAFQFIIPNIPPGSNILEIWAKDVLGIEGPKVVVRGIFAAGANPEPRIAAIKGGSLRNPLPVTTGMGITPEAKMLFDFTVQSAVPIVAASITFNDRAVLPVTVRGGKDNIYRADVPVPLDLPQDLIKATLRATDRNGREGIYDEFFYTSRAGEQKFAWVRPHMTDDNRILLSSADDFLVGLVGGVQVGDVQLSGSGSENLYASVYNGQVRLQARGQGSFGPVTLQINSRTLSSEPFSVIADFSDPAISVASSGGWFRDEVQFRFGVAAASRVRSVEVSMNLGETWESLLSPAELASLNANTGFDRTLNIARVPDGTEGILFRATDEAGRTGLQQLIVQKDSVPPEPHLIMPIVEANVNGTVRLGIAIKETGSLKKVTYNKPASPGSPAITRQVYPADDYVGTDPRFLNILMDSVEMPLDNNMRFTFEDEAGNVSELTDWTFVIDNERDIPIAHIVLPLEDELITADFEVSGVAFDDDAIALVYWHIDNNADQVIDTGGSNGYTIPISLSTLTDNEHTVTIVAEDIYGVKSAPVTRPFRVSLREPMAGVTTPSFDLISAGLIEMSGGAFDENGVEQVRVSLDNGLTYNDTRITPRGDRGQSAEWFYELNSTVLRDGPHIMFIKAFDKYGISAIYAGLVNIDNTPPEITLEYPMDGTITTGMISIMGDVADINLEEKLIELRSLEGKRIPNGYRIVRVNTNPFLKESFDMAPLQEGLYNIQVTITDKAGNVTSVSRNIELSKEQQTNSVEILYPLVGEHVQGNFILYGSTTGADVSKTVTLRINDVNAITTDTLWTGFYGFALDEQFLKPGWNEFSVISNFGTVETYDENEAGERVLVSSRIAAPSVVSTPVRIFYQPDGPWVTIDSMTMGDFAFERPWLTGRSGYTLNDEDRLILGDRKADTEARAEVMAKTLDFVDISFDNGQTFVPTTRTATGWRYRIENEDMAEGYHYLLVRAQMKNGDVAVTRTTVQVDQTSPFIRLVAPEPGGRYNQELEFAVMASDDVALASLSYHLRIGDKAFYEVPGFLQGLYFEATIPPFIRQITNEAPVIFAGGATYMDVGFGLSFFEDNVKIQVQYGFLSQEQYEALGGEPKFINPYTGKWENTVRYGGHVFGIKLLAGVYNLPFRMLMGPDWEWGLATVAGGANFSLFDLASEGYTQSGDPPWMSALLVQMEFPKVTIPKRKNFRTFSLFTEGQLWFVPTDVPAKDYGLNIVIPHVIMGLRMYIF